MNEGKITGKSTKNKTTFENATHMDIKIIRISAVDTYPVRHAELRKGRPLSSCAFVGDDLESTIHIGAYNKDMLIGVASFMAAPFSEQTNIAAMQLRGMAVLAGYHRRGVGAKMLQAGEQLLDDQNIFLLWMNARIAAIPFYRSSGYLITGSEFDIPEVGAHYKMWKRLSHS